jgi:glycolate oxidase
MGLLGATSVAQLGPNYVSASMPTNMPHVHSAFPLLRLDDSGY